MATSGGSAASKTRQGSETACCVRAAVLEGMAMGVRMRGAIRGPAVTASLLLLLLTGVASPVGAQAAAGDPQPPGERTVLEGTAIYRERMRLPPGAVFEAQIEDTSRAEAPADVVARTTVPSPGGPPIPFAVAYDPARIDPSGTYVVRARIVVGNAVLFTTDAVTRVLTGGHPASASLLLRRVLGGAPTMAGPPAVTTSTQSPPSFEQTRWAAARLGATDVTATGSRAPHLVFEGGRASGSDGCNRVSGGYTVDGQALTFGPMVGTQMACPGTGEVERAFGAAVRDTRRWRIEGETLELLDAKGDVVARFVASRGSGETPR